MTTLNNILVLGIDPAPTSIGIAIVEYHRVGGVQHIRYLHGEVLKKRTSKFTPKDIAEKLRELPTTYFSKVVVAGIEDAFIGENKQSGLGVLRVGAWCQMWLSMNCGAPILLMLHQEWRNLAWGTTRWEKHDVVVKAATDNLTALGWTGFTEHEAEAVGIAIAAGRKYFDSGGLEHGN